MMLWVSWPLNEGAFDLGLLLSVDEKRAGTARRTRQAWRRAAAAAAGAVKLCPRPLGILPASRDMAQIGVSRSIGVAFGLGATGAACRVVGGVSCWSGPSIQDAKD
jgi:hypothetical protein